MIEVTTEFYDAELQPLKNQGQNEYENQVEPGLKYLISEQLTTPLGKKGI